MEERLQKLIAAAGLCSRRTAENWMEEGRVTVNGTVAHLGVRADPEKDIIEIDGKPLVPKEKFVYLMLHKPRGYTCSLSDPYAKKLVTELLSGIDARVYPVGRLDVESEGLLFLTNDGAFTQQLIHPRHEMEKCYHVTVSGYQDTSIQRLCAIRDLDGEVIHPAEVELLQKDAKSATLQIIIHEGKKRQIRRMCAKVGLSVRSLKRVREGEVTLGDLPVGQWRYLSNEEVKMLKNA